ncbi:MAG TPA: aspartate ammonia-lyase [Candidatus Sulfotelmatobacter sp.]|nr:aspartate ammonia-lyase [Candidatus Sulfotelmatobacter sp.]
METRCEIDSLGEKILPKSAYYGVQTLRAVENFPISGIQHPTVFIKSYVQVKKAAAQANMEVGWLDLKIGEAIVQACDEVLANKFLDQFVVDVFQAGAGTSFNMNINEILANRALELLGKEKGDYKSVNPNDHVNMSQSTNDTFPTALHVAVLTAIQPLFNELENVASSFEVLSKRYNDIIKSGRTHLQDALPVTVGQEFGAYCSTLRNALDELKKRQQDLYQVALGATATGTGANTHPRYRQLAISKLGTMTSLPLTWAKNSFEALQSCRRLAAISSGLKELALELVRIANDLRLLSSGPTTGLAEIQLPAVQPGSSIMPGKVNPVIAECLNMVAFQVLGNDLTVAFAVQAGQLELNVMTPVIMYNVLFSIQILTNCLIVLREKCVKGIQVDEERCRNYLDKNPALATFLSPKIGYLEASMIAKQAVEEDKSVKEVAVQKNVLNHEELDRVFDRKNLMGKTSEE